MLLNQGTLTPLVERQGALNSACMEEPGLGATSRVNYKKQIPACMKYKLQFKTIPFFAQRLLF